MHHGDDHWCTAPDSNGEDPGFEPGAFAGFRQRCDMGEEGGDACGNRTRFVLLDRQVLGQ